MPTDHARIHYLRYGQLGPSVQEERELRWCQAYRLGRDPREELVRVQAASERDQPFSFNGTLKMTGSLLLLAPASVFPTIGLIIVREEGYKVDHSLSLLLANISEVRAAFSRLARARATANCTRLT